MASKVVAIFIEGDTEVDFYSKLIAFLHERKPCGFECRIMVKNLKGVGNYQNKAVRIFENGIKAKYPDSEYTVILCYDTDAFEFNRKPPVNWPAVTKALKEKGANHVEQVRAVTSIEDWFLYDREGLENFLHIPKRKMAKYKGQKGLSELFRKANRSYIKGIRCNGLIDALDMEVIFPKIEKEIKPILAALKSGI